MCNNVGLDEDTASKTRSSCLSRQDGSTDMQHDLFGSGHDLDLRSNFIFDLLRSNYISFDASCRGKHDGVRIISLPYLEPELSQKTISVKIGYFGLS